MLFMSASVSFWFFDITYLSETHSNHTNTSHIADVTFLLARPALRQDGSKGKSQLCHFVTPGNIFISFVLSDFRAAFPVYLPRP